MAHGAPDWSRYRSDSTSYSLQDLAEHAVRLGSIVSFDRRGDVIHLCSFEDGLGPYQVSALGLGSAAVLSAETARTGAYSVKLTGPSEPVGPAMLWHWLPYPVLSRMGFEVSFTIGEHLDHIDFFFWLYDSALLHRADLRFSLPANTLYYRDAVGAWVALLTGLGCTYSDYIFHTVKVVADWRDQEYGRVILDSRTQDMAGRAYQAAASAIQPSLLIQATVYPVADENAVCYFDDVIVTHNEQ